MTQCLITFSLHCHHIQDKYLNIMGNSASNTPILPTKTIFDFSVPNAKGIDVSLNEYRGKKAYIVVNVACECGLTTNNYKELQEVYEKYNKQGLEILAFPCNNFGGQEPRDNDYIQEFAKGRGATFPVLGKLECDNGDKTHPFYTYLKSSISGGILGHGLKWNFAKFLVNRDGVPIQRYLPTTGPKALENDIQKLLSLPDIAASDSATTPAATAAAEGSCATDGSVAK